MLSNSPLRCWLTPAADATATFDARKDHKQQQLPAAAPATTTGRRISPARARGGGSATGWTVSAARDQAVDLRAKAAVPLPAISGWNVGARNERKSRYQQQLSHRAVLRVSASFRRRYRRDHSGWIRALWPTVRAVVGGKIRGCCRRVSSANRLPAGVRRQPAAPLAEAPQQQCHRHQPRPAADDTGLRRRNRQQWRRISRLTATQSFMLRPLRRCRTRPAGGRHRDARRHAAAAALSRQA